MGEGDLKASSSLKTLSTVCVLRRVGGMFLILLSARSTSKRALCKGFSLRGTSILEEKNCLKKKDLKGSVWVVVIGEKKKERRKTGVSSYIQWDLSVM